MYTYGIYPSVSTSTHPIVFISLRLVVLST